MAEIRPFRAYRPRKGKEKTIAALPYDVFSREEARVYVTEHPGSFLEIDRAETQFPEDTDIYAPAVYAKAGELLWQRIHDGDFVQDEQPCYYLYQQVWHGRTQTGIVACASVDDYLHSVIKKHENTVAVKERDRVNHVAACHAQTGPVFLAYRNHKEIDAITKAVIDTQAPVYDFVYYGSQDAGAEKDSIRNRVWIINREEQIRQLQEAFSQIQQIYIADGHHRAAAAVKVCQQEREKNPAYTREEPFNYFLCVLFPAGELEILPYNRVVKDVGGLDKSEILLYMKRHFNCVPYRKTKAQPTQKGEIGMYLDGSWYLLSARNSQKSGDVVAGLDVSILQRHVLAPLFHIENPRTDPRIEFVGGIRGLEELEKRADTYDGVAFAMYPTSIEELFAVADAGRLMPPKSTWFEPKLLSGLFIHDIREK